MAEERRCRFLVAAAFALTQENASLGSVIGKKLREGKAGKNVLSRFCEKCGILAIPGETADFRVKKGKLNKHCLSCSRLR